MNYNGKQYYTELKDIKFYISYGLGPDNKTDITTPLSVQIEEYTNEQTNNHGFDYIIPLPDDVVNFIFSNTDKNCYLELTSVDAVGNKAIRMTYVPKKVNFFNYTVDNNNILTLHFDDRSSSNIQNELNLQDYTINVLHYIYYAEKKPGQTIRDLVFKRNQYYTEVDNPNDGDPENTNPNNHPRFEYNSNGELIDNDPWENHSHKNSFMIKPDSEYVVLISTIYIYNTNNFWNGTMNSVINIIDNISKQNLNTQDTNFANNLSSCTPVVTKQIQPKNTGLTKLTIDNSNLTEAGVTYYYGWSKDGSTWNYYNTNEFLINTFLEPPEGTWGNDDSIDPYDFQNSNTRKAPTRTFPASSYSNTGYVKIFAKKDNLNTIKESQSATVTFSDTDDNIPPVINEWKHSHDLTISSDGTFFTTINSCAEDKEWNEISEFTYYFTDYSPSWGNDFHILSKSDILKLPNANQQLFYRAWKENSFFKKGDEISIPVNGLKDGDYMIFITMKDKYDNSVTDGLGKIHVRTYNSKLNVSYTTNSNNKINKIYSSLSLGANDPSLSVNKIFIRFYDTTNNKWCSFGRYPNGNAYYSDDKDPISQNHYQANKMTKTGNTLSFETNNSNNYPLSGQNNFDFNELPTNNFYKFNVTSYDIDPESYLTISDEGFHIYNVPTNAETIPSTVHYDAFVNETVSYPTYMYLPTKTNVNSFMERSSGTVMSNDDVLINVISSLFDLGDNIDEWERRGKTIYSTVKSPSSENNATFNNSEAMNAMFNANEKGKRYFVVTAHFADNTSAISRVFEKN